MVMTRGQLSIIPCKSLIIRRKSRWQRQDHVLVVFCGYRVSGDGEKKKKYCFVLLYSAVKQPRFGNTCTSVGFGVVFFPLPKKEATSPSKHMKTKDY